MDDFEHDLTALKEAFAPIHAANGHDQVDPDRFGEDCGNAVKAHPGASARFAAFSVYQHAKVAPETPLTVIDPAPRPWFRDGSSQSPSASSTPTRLRWPSSSSWP